MALVSAVLIKTVVRPMIFLGYMVLANRIFQHLDAVKVFWCFGLTALTTFIIAMVMVRRTTPDLARGSMPVYEVRQWLALSTPFMLNALVLLASRRAGLLTLEALSPHEAQVGILAGGDHHRFLYQYVHSDHQQLFSAANVVSPEEEQYGRSQ